MTRKLRRRPNDPVPEKVEKRRKPPPAQLNYLLDEKEIELDLKAINRAKAPTAVRKPGAHRRKKYKICNKYQSIAYAKMHRHLNMYKKMYMRIFKHLSLHGK
jgi:hypothetical protein